MTLPSTASSSAFADLARGQEAQRGKHALLAACEAYLLAGQFDRQAKAQFSELFRYFLPRTDRDDRIHIASRLSKSRYLPMDVLMLLCCEEPEVATPMLSHSPLLDEASLTMHILQGQTAHREAIARRKDMSPVLAFQLLSFCEGSVAKILKQHVQELPEIAKRVHDIIVRDERANQEHAGHTAMSKNNPKLDELVESMERDWAAHYQPEDGSSSATYSLDRAAAAKIEGTAPSPLPTPAPKAERDLTASDTSICSEMATDDTVPDMKMDREVVSTENKAPVVDAALDDEAPSRFSFSILAQDNANAPIPPIEPNITGPRAATIAMPGQSTDLEWPESDKIKDDTSLAKNLGAKDDQAISSWGIIDEPEVTEATKDLRDGDVQNDASALSSSGQSTENIEKSLPDENAIADDPSKTASDKVGEEDWEAALENLMSGAETSANMQPAFAENPSETSENTAPDTLGSARESSCSEQEQEKGIELFVDLDEDFSSDPDFQMDMDQDLQVRREVAMELSGFSDVEEELQLFAKTLDSEPAISTLVNFEAKAENALIKESFDTTSLESSGVWENSDTEDKALASSELQFAAGQSQIKANAQDEVRNHSASTPSPVIHEVAPMGFMPDMVSFEGLGLIEAEPDLPSATELLLQQHDQRAAPAVELVEPVDVCFVDGSMPERMATDGIDGPMQVVAEQIAASRNKRQKDEPIAEAAMQSQALQSEASQSGDNLGSHITLTVRPRQGQTMKPSVLSGRPQKLSIDPLSKDSEDTKASKDLTERPEFASHRMVEMDEFETLRANERGLGEAETSRIEEANPASSGQEAKEVQWPEEEKMHQADWKPLAPRSGDTGCSEIFFSYDEQTRLALLQELLVTSMTRTGKGSASRSLLEEGVAQSLLSARFADDIYRLVEMLHDLSGHKRVDITTMLQDQGGEALVVYLYSIGMDESRTLSMVLHAPDSLSHSYNKIAQLVTLYDQLYPAAAKAIVEELFGTPYRSRPKHLTAYDAGHGANSPRYRQADAQAGKPVENSSKPIFGRRKYFGE